MNPSGNRKQTQTGNSIREKMIYMAVDQVIVNYDENKKGFLHRSEVYQLLWDSFLSVDMGLSQLAKVPDITDVIEERFYDGRIPYEALRYIIKPLVERKLLGDDDSVRRN